MNKMTIRWMTWLTLIALCLSLFALPAMAAEEAALAEEETAVSEPAGQAETDEPETPSVNIISLEDAAETPDSAESGAEAGQAAEETAEPVEGEEPSDQADSEEPQETEEPETPAEEPEEPVEPGVTDEPGASEETSGEPSTLDGDPVMVTITYMHGTTELKTEEVTSGGKPVQAPEADENGRTIKTWTDKDGKLVVLADTVVEKDVTFYVWHAPALKTEDHDRYINGTGNAQFSPKAQLTRAQAATILYQLLDSQEKGPYNNSFSDVSDSAWYSTAVKTLASIGVINGYTDGSFRPNRAVTRAEFVTMLVNLTGVTGSTSSFTDVSGHWARASIEAAASQGWINGYSQSDGTYTFRPNNNITRAEAVAVMNRVLGRSADKDTIANGAGIMHFIDVKTTDWWYGDVMEASIGHTYAKTGSAETWTNYTIEKSDLTPGVHKVGGSFVFSDANSQPVYMEAGINLVEGSYYFAETAGYTFTADLSVKPGYVVFASGLTDQALTDGFNQIGTALFYWRLSSASPQKLTAGLNTIGGKTYWADKEGYIIRNDFHEGVVELGGKKYLADAHCAIITRGLAYSDDTSLPATMDLRGKTFEHKGYMYYIQSDYSLATDKWIGYLYFDSNGRYTSGDSELDGYVYNIVKGFVDNNALTHEQKLLKAYYHLRGGTGADFVDNGFKYLPVGNIFYRGRYNAQDFYGYFIESAKQMYTKNYGRCFEWGAGYLYLARRLGFQAYLVVGGIGNESTTHCWNMIYWSGKWHISDVEIEWGWLSGYYGGGYKLYRNLFAQTLSSENVTYYVNPETSTVSYYFPY